VITFKGKVIGLELRISGLGVCSLNAYGQKLFKNGDRLLICIKNDE